MQESPADFLGREERLSSLRSLSDSFWKQLVGFSCMLPFLTFGDNIVHPVAPARVRLSRWVLMPVLDLAYCPVTLRESDVPDLCAGLFHVA